VELRLRSRVVLRTPARRRHDGSECQN
jgi:hypothetical protein